MPENKICIACGSKNPSTNNFCEHCGAKLSTVSHSEKVAKVLSTPKNPKIANSVPDTAESEKSIPASSPNTVRLSFSWIQVIYAILLLIAVFTRFDHLGYKPHHHDESMHSFYSFQLFHDGDYEYNPMMHGPFQFHGNAFMYYLFGVSDATSRYLAAFFGILTVILAMLSGPYLGRTGALIATCLVVFSPSFMYFDRFTREDAYIAGATFMWVVFLFRYLRSRLPLDLWLASVGFIIAFCTKESMFLTLAVIGTYLFIRLLPWIDVFIAGGLVAFGVLIQIAPISIPQRVVVFLILAGCAFLYTVYQLFTRWNNNVKKGPESKIWGVICELGIEKIQWDILGFIVWWVLTLAVLRFTPLNLNQPTFFSLVLFLAYLFFVFRFCWLWLKNVSSALTGSISIMLIIFTLLFTTFFSVGQTQPNFLGRIHYFLNAIYNGAFGGLEYWWGQHSVHRGDEPWYYYLLQLPANEMVSTLFALVAMVYYGLFKRKIVPLFLSYWFVGSVVLFSWAGEKMPWLILHLLLPGLLLTAFFVGEIIDSKPAEQVWKCIRIAALLVFGILISYSLHSAVLLSFYHEANPVEPLVYVQSGMDTKEVEKIVRQISYEETGGTDLPLTIEDKCSWPFAWCLKDFPKRNHPAVITAADNPIIMTGTESDAQAYPILSKAGYLNRKYKLRVWWVPSWFKKGFPSSEINWDLFRNWLFSNFIPLGSARSDMVDWSDIKKWVLYREVWSDMGSYNMRLWVRPDLALKYGFTETNRADIPAEYPKPEPVATDTSSGKKHPASHGVFPINRHSQDNGENP